MNNENKNREMLKEGEFRVAEGYEAEVKDGVITIRKAESHDEWIRKDMIETISKEAKEFPASYIASKAELWIPWLKKQKEQIAIGQQEKNPVEWSKEDEKNRYLVYGALNQVYNLNLNKELSVWFNKRCAMRSWIPSEEQMEVLNDIINVISSRDIQYHVLSELWKDLKKLREE